MSYRHLRRLLVFLSLCIVVTSASASRVALVIGNGAYTDTSILPNASNDGRAVAERLRKLGFQVLEGIDLNRGQMQSVISQFSRELRDAEVGLFFYAGHGMQVEGENHLVPVNAVIKDDADLPFQTIPVDIILRQMERSVATRLVFLDACRDNPLARTLARSLNGTSRSVSVDQGLAQMQAGVGTLIAYATEPDAVALDGDGPNSPFTTALLKHLDTPGLEIRQLLTRVRQEVLAMTDNQQVPWDHSSLTGGFYFLPEAEAEPPGSYLSPVDDQVNPSIELAFWQSTQQIQDPATRRMALEAYLARYPEGEFAPLAEMLIASLTPASGNRGVTQQPEPTPEPPPASTPEPEPEPESDTEVAMAEPPVAKPTEPAEPAKPETPAAAPVVDPETAEVALNLDHQTRLRIQQRLTVLGFDTYGADGVFGPNTRKAISDYQRSREFPVTGFLLRDQVLRLQDEAAPALARAAREAEAARKAREAQQAKAAREVKAARGAKLAQETKAAEETKTAEDAKAAERAQAARRAAAARRAKAKREAQAAQQAPAPAEEKPVNYGFRRCMMNYEKSYSDCVREHGQP